ncbi:MAG TPA: TrmH family RNA methyltransferase [Kribbellaceae bacterium]|nr:TrmH family RNA methyltransferase [Kribbellaceae bacterium]
MQAQQIGVGHPEIKRVLDLQRNATTNPDRLFVAEGLWAHNVLLEAGVGIETFLWCPEAGYSDEARLRVEQVAERAYRSYRISEKTLARIAERERPDGLVSVARLPRWDPADVSLGDPALVLVADAVEIPGNLGTLLRTLDACRGDCLVLTNRRVRLTHPKVFRGSQGMSVRVPTIELPGPAEAVEWLGERGFAVFLADTDGARHYRRTPYGRRTALVVGSERYGISPQWYEHGFDRVAVPMLGRADSLNVSVSASILLYEIRAQQDRW